MSCYICNKAKSSVEHVPAKCFFPPDRRYQLITVDSCEEHNEDTSKDDEYVRNIIAMSINNNQVALDHFLKKCIKSFEKSPGLLKITTDKKQQVFYKNNEDLNGTIKPATAFGIDRARINLVMKKIAYGLFYHKFGQKWDRELLTGTEHLRTQTMDADDMGHLIQEVKAILPNIVFDGLNPEVFQYVFSPTEALDLNDQILIMKFYEGFEMWIIPKENSTGPVL